MQVQETLLSMTRIKTYTLCHYHPVFVKDFKYIFTLNRWIVAIRFIHNNVQLKHKLVLYNVGETNRFGKELFIDRIVENVFLNVYNV